VHPECALESVDGSADHAIGGEAASTQ
jgi:hypothetical protein